MGKAMISEKFKTVFVHNPKAAGTSVKLLLQEQGNDWKCNDWHHNIEILSKKTDRLWENYYSFGICRNPYSRFVSAFLYNVKKIRNLGDYHWDKYPTAYTILSKWIGSNRHNIDNFQDFVLGPDFDSIFDKGWPIHFKPQYQFLTGIRKDVQLNNISRFEDISTDTRLTIKLANNEIELSLPILNNNKPYRYQDFYNVEEVMSKVRDKYILDFHNFDYDTDL